jgi:hypothetical protein
MCALESTRASEAGDQGQDLGKEGEELAPKLHGNERS